MEDGNRLHGCQQGNTHLLREIYSDLSRPFNIVYQDTIVFSVFTDIVVISSVLKFDDANKLFEVSVRDLAEGESFVAFERGEGWNRFGLGTEVHSRVLKKRCISHPGYRAEVRVQLRVPVGDWAAIVSGRLDGCFQEDSGRWLIEEFKSAYLPDARRGGDAFEKHKQQLLFYCYLWSRMGNPTEHASLIYVDIAGGREEAIDVPYDEGKTARNLERRLHQILAIWKAEEQTRQKKALASASLPFPHAEPRPGQRVLIEAVRQALDHGDNLLAEAPTGSGKTAAGLFPALVHGLSTGKQVVFLTSKTLQQRMAVSALQAMNASGAFRTLQMRAKEKMCANPQVICHEDFCPYAAGFADKMERSGLLDRLSKKLCHYDPDLVFEEAKREEVCPFEVQIQLAEKADAIVADYNYVFEPGTALGHLDGESPFILLVDEAHNLPDRARRIFSPELLEEELKNLKAKLLKQPGQMFELLYGIVDNVHKLLESTARTLSKGQNIAEIEPPTLVLLEEWEDWEEAFVRYLGWKHETQNAMPDDPVVDFHYTFRRFISILNLYGSGFTSVIERREEGLRLAIVCLDPARALRPIFQCASSTVLMSATLSPVGVIQRMLGLDSKNTVSISLPPPFPREHRKILILPQVSTAYSTRDKYYKPIAQHIIEMANAHSGNTLALFPSYAFLTTVFEQLPKSRARVVVQRPNFTEKERREIFDILTAPPPEGILLLAVLGGMYAEGVDYPGELLSAVFVVSPGLPQVSFERELLRKYFDETERAGFEYAYLQPGMIRVVQAAGRLIRSETDRGVIALLCRRFLQEPYASHLPRDWYKRSPAELIARNPAAEVRAFFDHHSPQ